MISFNLGGEKLNVRYTVIAAALFAAVSFTNNLYNLSAQESSQDVEVSEDVSNREIIGETVPAPRPNPEEDIRFDDPENNTSAVDTLGLGSVWVMVRMVGVLALAALAIYGVVFFIKRLAGPKQVRDPYLKILASTPVGSGCFAAVLSVGSKAWLVGGGGEGLSLIAEIDEQEALESMLIDDARKAADIEAGRFPDFRSLLRKIGKGRGTAESSKHNTLNFHADNLRKQRDRLRGL